MEFIYFPSENERGECMNTHSNESNNKDNYRSKHSGRNRSVEGWGEGGGMVSRAEYEVGGKQTGTSTEQRNNSRTLWCELGCGCCRLAESFNQVLYPTSFNQNGAS